jgi:hypothetical protein
MRSNFLCKEATSKEWLNISHNIAGLLLRWGLHCMITWWPCYHYWYHHLLCVRHHARVHVGRRHRGDCHRNHHNVASLRLRGSWFRIRTRLHFATSIFSIMLALHATFELSFMTRLSLVGIYSVDSNASNLPFRWLRWFVTASKARR